MAAAQLGVRHAARRPGSGSGTLAASEWLFQPLRAGERMLAVLGLARDDGGDPVRADQLPLLTSLIDQAALVLERLRLEAEMRDVDAVRDARPAARGAAVVGQPRSAHAADRGHRRPPTSCDHGATPELIATIESEAARLNRFVANLLDMARVEAGALQAAASSRST